MTDETTMDDEGRCISHPFVQLQRLSIVTGKWKTLLDCCPLCAMDSKSSSASRGEECSSSSICSGGADEISSSKDRARSTTKKSTTTTTTAIDDAARSSSVLPSSPPPPPLQPLHSTGSKGGSGDGNIVRRSRVRFQPEKDVQFTTTSTTTTFTTNNNWNNHLFHQQQQHHHQQIDQQQDDFQLHSNMKRSMSSSSLPAHFTSSGSSVSSSMSKSALKAQPRYKVCELMMQQQLDDSEKVTTMSMDLSLSMDDLASSNGVSHSSSEIKKREELVPDNHDVIPLQQQQQVDLGVLPDPEEFPCYNTHQTRVSDDSRHHQVTHYSSSSSSPPPPQGWKNCRSPYQTDSSSGMMQSLQASPSSKARSLQHSRQQQQQPIYSHSNMVIDPTPDYDDEVSTLNSTGYSVLSHKVPSSSSSSSTSHNTHVMAHQHADDNASLNTNTNDCDDTGRCIHHPHIRLRKKKLFGKGWKVLMSACPDCCVNELHRMRAVAENKARIRERSVEGNSTSRSSNSSRSARRSVSPHFINNGDEETRRATTPRSRSTSKGSCSGHSRSSSRDEGRTWSTSRSDTRSSSSRHGHVNSNVLYHNQQDQDSTSRSPAAALPTKRSPSLNSTDRRHQQHETVVSSASANTTKLMHRESDETTASLTGSSSGSSNEITPDNSDRTSSTLSSGEVLPSGQKVNTTNLRTCDSVSSRIVDKSNSKRHHHHSQLQQHDRHQQEEEEQPRQSSIQVRKMQWTDPKNGQMGSYTGQVNTSFIPHGRGVMEYHDSTLSVKDGRWKEGRYRKSSSSSSSSRKGDDGRSSSRSASRSRSKSRDGGRHRARSSSRRPESNRSS